MADDDVVWVPVLPSLRGFASELTRGTRGAAEKAGREAGDAYASGLERAQSRADSAAKKLAAAQDRVADAAGRSRVAEAKLEELRKKGNASASQLAAAEERVASTKRAEERATATLTDAQKNLDAANKQVEESTRAVGVEVEETGKKSIVSGENLKKFGAMAAAGVAAAGGALLKMGSDWKDIENSIRTGSGASGAALDGLVASAKAVGTTIPVEFAAAGDAVANLNTYTGATGESLERLTVQLMDASRMLGEDGVANSSAFGKALVQWGMTAEEGADALDGLFVATQNYGVGLDGLMKHLNSYGSVLQNAGFSMEEASVFFGNLEKSGLSVSRIMPALNASMRNWAAEGVNVKDALADTVTQIRETESTTEALALATDVFGAQGAQRLTTAVRQGTFVLEDFGTALGDTEGAIANNSAETRTMADAWLSLKNDGLALVEPVATRVFDLVNTGLQWISEHGVPAVKALGEWLYEAFQSDTVQNFLSTAVPLVQDFLSSAMDLGRDVLPVLGDALQTAGAFVGDVVDAVRDVVDWFREHETVAKTLGTVIAVGLLPHLVSLAVSFGSAAAAAATSAATLVASWVRAQVAAVTSAAAQVAASYRTVGGWVAAGAAAMAQGAIMVAQWVRAGAVATAQAAIAGAAWVASSARTVGALALQGAAFVTQRALMVAGAAATGIMTAAQWALNVALNANPIGLVIGLLVALGAAVAVAWNKSETFRRIVTAAWDGIKNAASWAWDNVLEPVFSWFGDAISATGDAATWLYENAIKPAWDGIGSAISWVWENVVSPVFDSLRSGVDLVAQAFQTAVDWIAQVWDRIKAIAAAPVKFVIESVYNNGIRSAWNKVAGWLGLDELEEYKPSWLGAYAGGGVLPGYSPDRDNLRFISTDGSAAIELGGGEAILRPEVARAVGPGWVDGVNQAARRGPREVRQYLGAFAGGGIIESIVGIAAEKFPGLSVTSTLRNTNDYHGAGKAVDLSNQVAGGPSTPLMQEAARYFYEEHGPDLAELIHWPLNGWQNIKEGAPFNFGEPTNSQHTDHVHVAAHSPLGGGGGFGDWAKGIWSAATGWLRRRVADAFDAIMNPIGDMIPDFGGSLIGSVPRAAFDSFRGNVRDWLLGKADDQEGAGGSGVPGTGPVVDQVREAMAAYGWDEGAQWDAVQWIVSRESGWNPTAVNPDSGAFGLFQFNPSSGTLQEYLPDRNPNPRIQAEAFGQYVGDRYGTPVDARRFWEENGWYDRGGLASGVGVMLKNVIEPERVLDPQTTAAFETLVPHLTTLAGGFEDLPGGSEYASFLTQLPAQIGEEMGRDALDFFGLGGISNLVFADPPAASEPAVSEPAEPAASGSAPDDVDTSDPGGGSDGGSDRSAPLVWIENMIAFDAEEAAEHMRREALRLVRSDALTGGW